MMNVHRPPREARRAPEWFDGLPQAVERAFEELDFTTTEAYIALQELAGQVQIEGQSIDTESSVIDAQIWIAPGTIYVTLVYDPNSDDPVQMPDSYPMTIFYHVDNQIVDIDRVTADTSSFYE